MFCYRGTETIGGRTAQLPVAERYVRLEMAVHAELRCRLIVTASWLPICLINSVTNGRHGILDFREDRTCTQRHSCAKRYQWNRSGSEAVKDGGGIGRRWKLGHGIKSSEILSNLPLFPADSINYNRSDRLHLLPSLISHLLRHDCFLRDSTVISIAFGGETTCLDVPLIRLST